MQSALEAGARKLVVGLGGSGTNDGGAGMLGALGAVDGSGSADPFRTVRGLRGITQVDLSRCVEALRGVELVAGSDVDNPLLGLRGATNVYGGQKGITDDRKMFFESCLEDFANATDRRLADAKGAGAAGGLGFGLLLLGAERVPGVDLVAGAVRLAEHAAWADLVITGEGTFDFQSRSGKVVYGVAEAAGQAVRPCIALAGQVDVGAREMRAMGVESAYSLADLVGLDEALNRPRESLVELGARVARTWSH